MPKPSKRKHKIKSREVREIVEEAELIGWRFERFTGHSCVLLVHPSGARVSISQSPHSPERAYRNARAGVRRVVAV
jgi:hypothetical protein